MIDIGANLLHPQLAGDLDAVLARARGAGLTFIMVTSTDIAETRRAIDLSVAHEDLGCTAGVHPHAAKDVTDRWVGELEVLAADEQVLAIGETGLDFHRNFSPPDMQKEVFARQIELAAGCRLPLFVHDRDSEGAVADMLEPAQLSGVVIHCFTGNRRDLERYIDAGYYIGITGWVCDKRRGDGLRQLVPMIPLERLLIETDAPFLMPHGAPPPSDKPRRNEPCLLPHVAREIARIRDQEAAEVAAATVANARRLFAIRQPVD